MATTKKVFGFIALGFTAFVVIMALIAFIASRPSYYTQEEFDALPQGKKDSIVEARLRRDSIAAIKKADKKFSNKNSEAYVMAKEYVLQNVKYPKTANFPILYDKIAYAVGGTYIVSGTVEVENAFGVSSEHSWVAVMHYNGGDDLAKSSWICSNVSIR